MVLDEPTGTTTGTSEIRILVRDKRFVSQGDAAGHCPVAAAVVRRLPVILIPSTRSVPSDSRVPEGSRHSNELPLVPKMKVPVNVHVAPLL